MHKMRIGATDRWTMVEDLLVATQPATWLVLMTPDVPAGRGNESSLTGPLEADARLVAGFISGSGSMMEALKKIKHTK